LKKRKGGAGAGGGDDQEPQQDAEPRTDTPAAAPGRRSEMEGYTRPDRVGMRRLIDSKAAAQ
jgi:hypothetical protein